MVTSSGFSIHEKADGAWTVVAVLKNGMEATYGGLRFANEATATLYAIDCHKVKPFINYAARRV